MKPLYVLAALLLASNLVVAQEKVADEHAQQLVKVLVKQTAEAKTPVKIEIDEDQPFAMKEGELGALVVPAKKLSATVIEKAGKDVVPIAQLWMKGLAPQVDGKTLANDKLTVLKFKHDDQDVMLTMYVIGVRKGEKGLEVVVYGKEKEPLFVAPLEKADSKQSTPVEFGVKKGDDSATLTFRCAGKYQFQLNIAKQLD